MTGATLVGITGPGLAVGGCVGVSDGVGVNVGVRFGVVARAEGWREGVIGVDEWRAAALGRMVGVRVGLVTMSVPVGLATSCEAVLSAACAVIMPLDAANWSACTACPIS